MRDKTNISMFGLSFEVTQFSAVTGLEILFSKERVRPEKYLSCCVLVRDGNRIEMGAPSAINELIEDEAGIVPPAGVLAALIKLIHSFNFSFISTWEAVRVPGRFISGARTVSTKGTPSIISQLIQDDVATKRELEEYYSLKDAFQLLDIMTAKGVNAALAQEAADRDRKK